MSAETVEALSPGQSTRVISFEEAEVRYVDGSKDPCLIVSGTAPCLNMEVCLQAVIYIKCPEYWKIEVIGTLPNGFCLPATKPYTVSRPLTGIIGSKGIEVVGENKTQRFDVPGGCT